jgi:hypothetical protein
MVVRDADDFAFQRTEIIKGFLWSVEGVSERRLYPRRKRANVHWALKVDEREIEFAERLDERPGHFGPGLRADGLQPGRGKEVSRDTETRCDST